MDKEKEKPISVSQYIELLNNQLKKICVNITGEVSKAELAVSGHMYFDLKDEKDESVLRCVIWRSNYKSSGIKLENGMKIVAFGYADIWPQTGRLTFKASAIELIGEGILKKRYDALKKKLIEEGLFEPSRKRQIPKYPQRIGVITSQKSAVIHDFLNNLGNFGFKVKFMDARVEGPEAVPSLLKTIKAFRKIPLDVLVIMRGGGSIEALQAFDNELLVREVVKFPIPVIAGIGHHQDITLVALAADAAESTPTATAHLLGKSWEEAKWKLNQSQRSIFDSYENILSQIRGLIQFSEPLKIFEYFIERTKDSVSNFQDNFIHRFRTFINMAQQKLSAVEQIIKANSPERNLKLGYAIIRSGGKIVKSVSFIKPKDLLDLEVIDGIINTEVINIKKQNKYGQ
jgi:exodeoxyribonuclease VII large subunit